MNVEYTAIPNFEQRLRALIQTSSQEEAREFFRVELLRIYCAANTGVHFASLPMGRHPSVIAHEVFGDWLIVATSFLQVEDESLSIA